MWFLIIGALILIFAGGVVYLAFRAAHFPFVRQLAGERKWLARLLCLLFFAALAAFLWKIWGMMNMLICMVHLTVFWLISDFIALVVSKIRRKPAAGNAAGAAAIVFCLVYLSYGWYAAHHVCATTYTLETDKISRDIRIVQITDAHIGSNFPGSGLSRYVTEINALSPDAVVLTGDFVDDDTSREDMLAACDALGEFQTRYGVFFVYGNHDKGYYREEAKGWTNREMTERLEQNHVKILEDEAQLCDDFYIAGRKDLSENQRGTPRMSAEQFLSSLNQEKYILVLDHQPSDYDAEAAAGADLVLSGHTHGGQFIPFLRASVWLGLDDLHYGLERRLNTNFVVSSGISNWAFHFKTGCVAEYVVINIRGVR